MSRKPKARKVECWAVIGEGGYFMHGPSNSRSAVEKEALRPSGENFKVTKFVPFDPDAARVLKAAEKWTEGNSDAGEELQQAIIARRERRQKRGAK